MELILTEYMNHFIRDVFQLLNIKLIKSCRTSNFVVNSYDEINLDLLNKFSNNLNLDEINLEKLNINWWINKIDKIN